MRYHTNNPAQRAADIAEREAKIVWSKTHDFNQYTKRWIEIYNKTLIELCDPKRLAVGTGKSQPNLN